MSLIWSGRNLMSYTKGDLHITYKYDADGLRTQKTVNGVQHDYYYVDGQIAYEKVGNDYSLYYRYDQDGRLSMVIKNRLSDNYKWYFYLLLNTRGDIIGMNDAAGPLTVRYNYDAWGKVLSVTNAAGTQHTAGNFAHQISVRYRGYYYDEETELYYLQSRYYDPETGRFLNADDVNFIGYSGENLSYNAFAYCENNAVNGMDPLGTDLLNIIKDILKKILAGISSMFNSLFATNTVSVFSINNYDWMTSSETMGQQLALVARSKNVTVIPTTSNNFADEWNKMRSKYVIIHTHGDTTGIYDAGNPQQAIFTTSDMNKLKRNNKIRCVIITSCSVAGNAGLLKDNFARALSRKINSNGVVVGCRFNVLGGDTFFEPDHPNTNMPQPWIVYRNGLAIDRKLPNRISMQIVYTYLVENGYI